MALISLRKVSVQYGGPAVLDQISLSIEPGERACVTGRNGEGKSTLLKLLAGLIEPAAVLVALGFELPEGLLARLQTGEQFGLLADR
ncbi:MAG TPA: ATP-binding cassette domain-containing protein, partial [Kiritimatiellia bacterium]|nr:ATP-binding cassette domain-containing protein [Kiritimatiellia bacterium]